MSLPKDDLSQAWTDRDTFRDELDRQIVFANVAAGYDKYHLVEKITTIEVTPSGPKFTFTPDGDVRSVIVDGKSFGPDGKNVHYKAREK
jgi:hypothetical protein